MPARRVLDAGTLEPQAFDIGLPSDGNQQMAALDGAVAVLGLVHHPHAGAGTTLDTGDLGAFQNVHTLRPDVFQRNRRQFRVILAKRGESFDDGDLGAETTMRLGHFHADRAAADDNQMVGFLGPLEYGFIGQIIDSFQPGDRRHHRRGSGGDDKTAGTDFMIAGNHRTGIDETSLVLDDMHAQRREPLDRIIGRNGSDDRMNVVVDALKIDLRHILLDA